MSDERASSSRPQKSAPVASPTGRLNPVPTGSIMTMSARSSDGVFIVDQRIRGRRLLPDVGRHDPAGSHDAHVQPERRGPWAPIEREYEGPGGAVGNVGAEVRRVEELGGRVLLGVAQDDAPHHGLVFDRLAPPITIE